MNKNNFITEVYSKLTDIEKLILKDLLHDFLFLKNQLIENKGKLPINLIKNEVIIKQTIDTLFNSLSQENYSDHELPDIEKNINDFINSENKVNLMFFPIYKNDKFHYNINNSNYDYIFTVRKDFLDVLSNEKYIYLEYNTYNDFGITNFYDLLGENNDFKNIRDILIEKNISDYGEEINDITIKYLKTIHQRFGFISYEKGIINKLLEEINNYDSNEILYKDGKLFYKGSQFYEVKSIYSDRSKFLELFFSKPKETFIGLTDIAEYLENGNGSKVDDKSKKKNI